MYLRTILILTIFVFSNYTYGQGKFQSKDILPPEKGLIKVSILYPYGEGKTFDFQYYKEKHMPMVAGYLGSNLVKYSIEKGLASGIPDTPLPYMAIGIFYIKNLDEYKAAITPNRETIRADFPNYTNISPIILVSEVIY